MQAIRIIKSYFNSSNLLEFQIYTLDHLSLKKYLHLNKTINFMYKVL